MTAPVSFGVGVPDDTVLRLCGDVGGGRRVLELGVSDARNSLIVAQAGGKAIAVDPDPTRLAEVRDAAHAAELYVECFEADIADLGFATSVPMELVIADHTLAGVSDLPRLAPGAPGAAAERGVRDVGRPPVCRSCRRSLRRLRRQGADHR